MSGEVEYRSPRSERELADSFRCSHAALGGDASWFERIVRLDPVFRMENTRACFVDGRVVSVVQLFERRIRIGSCEIRAGAIGSVGTVPEYRGRGFGVGVLHDTARFLREDGFDLSLFFTAIRQHYAKGGWVIHPTSSLEVTLPETFPEALPDVTVGVCRDERDMEAVEAIYDAENASRTGTIVRTPPYWEARRKWHADREETVWLAWRKDRAVAYACEADGHVREMGRMGGEDEALGGLLAHLWAPLRSEGVETVRVREPVGGRGVIASIGCRTSSRESPSLMIRLVNLRSLMTKVVPLLSERSERAGIDADVRVRLETEGDTCSIHVGAGCVEVTDASEADEILRLSQNQMLNLVAGRLRVDQAAEANGQEPGGRVLEALTPLFPSDPFHHWTWDRRMHAE